VKKMGTIAVACTVVFGLAGLAAAQDPAGMPPMPKAGPEHALFKEAEGVWDAKVESWMVPGAPPSVSSGVETNRVGCGGMCLITDFKGSFQMGPSGPPTPFEGHGTETYDQAKKKYTGTWIDSMSVGMSLTESTYDPATKTMNGTMEGPDMTGKMQKMRSVVEHKAGQRIFTMYMTGPDGKEAPGMRITYTKRKGAAKK
jgi:hypothetical protein